MKILATLFCCAALAGAQELDPSLLLQPATTSWPQYHGDYSAERHSSLTQVTPQNVSALSLAWAFQTGMTQELKCSPILVQGVLYITLPDNVWAVDARSGHPIWHYTYPPNKGFHIGHRGVSMYGHWLYLTTADSHVVCLDARTGEVVWNVVVADSQRGYWMTMAPMIIRNHVIVGVSGDFDNLTGFLRSLDPETGKTQWQWDSTPPPGTPNRTTGGMTWMTGSYDPSLNLLYWGTGNPTPVLTGITRPGSDLYTCSIVALDPDTGKFVWAFQASPHDTHDWDAVETPVLADVTFNGQPRKVLMQASRNGYFFVLDRTNGKSLLTTTFGPVNWSKGVDANGSPIPNQEKEPARDGRLIAPSEGGLANYRSPSFDPKSGLFLITAQPSYGVYFAKPEDGTFGWAGADYDVAEKGVLEAIDYQTGKIRWSRELGEGHIGSGVLTTDSGVAFTGDTRGNFLAVETATGKMLWHAGSGAHIESSPITYELDGHQYVLMSGGGVLFAFALPE